MKNKDKIIRYSIYIVSIIGLAVCIAVLFPQVRQMIIESAERILHSKISFYQEWTRTLLSYAMGGIGLIVFFDYCLLTVSGKMLVRKVKSEIMACLVEIDWRSFVRPALLMFGIYLLGILSIIRANFLYLDDVGRTDVGYRGWYNWSRYVSEFFSIFVHADIRLTDISPLPQLLAALILALSSVSLLYILCNKKITVIFLFASVPIGLSPYMLECLSFKYDSPYMALSVLASIVPFLFLARKKAFVFCSVISLLVMCMTYQAASGIYLLIALLLSFRDWNSKRNSNREVFSFLGRAILSFCLAMLVFKLFLMRSHSGYASNAMFPLSQMFFNVWANLKNYTATIYGDFNLIWMALIGVILFFFIAKSVCTSARNKIVSFFVSVFLIGLLFILSYGVYLFLERPLFAPRAMYGFGVLLAIAGIYVVTDNRKPAIIGVLALSWCFFTFAFSYGNALADHTRYVNFRMSLLLHDLSALYPDKDENKIYIQLKNHIDFTPAVKNITAHNPVICRLVPIDNEWWTHYYYMKYFNYENFDRFLPQIDEQKSVDFGVLDLPVVKETYYHTIKSDGKHILVVLKH
ncbi:MAG: glucosyltransferase domain-containing protein [Dysgonamonadaceae bacterium]|jgi:hypothetical protein|nr:glucosyltransferase domain-containing protein [Dysgonamonadaceae bacterium]